MLAVREELLPAIKRLMTSDANTKFLIVQNEEEWEKKLL